MQSDSNYSRAPHSFPTDSVCVKGPTGNTPKKMDVAAFFPLIQKKEMAFVWKMACDLLSFYRC